MSRDDIFTTWNGADVRRRAQSLIGKSAWEIGLAVLSDAKLMCPVDYGYLAASLMASGQGKETALDSPSPKMGNFTRRETNRRTSTLLLLAPPTFRKIKPPGVKESDAQVFVGTAVEYGPYVEFGTIRSDAQPFLRPALDMARGKALHIVRSGARQEFAEYLK